MQHRKLWQAWGTIVVFLLVTAGVALAVTALFPAGKWQFPFGFGCAFMAGGIICAFLREKFSRSAVFSLLLNVLAFGCLIGAFLVGKKTALALPWTGILSAAGVLGVSYFFLMLLLSVPVLQNSRVYVACAFLLWLAAAGFGGYHVWKFLLFRFMLGAETVVHNERIVFYLLLTIVAAGLALGSLFQADSYSNLLIAMATPSVIATGMVAIIVLFALLGDGDCDCDGGCCDGCDCCDCSTDYGGRGKRNNVTTMSAMGNPDSARRK